MNMANRRKKEKIRIRPREEKNIRKRDKGREKSERALRMD